MPADEPAAGPTWVALARNSIAARLAERTLPACPADALRPHSGVFVTLERGGHLRGCMGVLDGTLPLDEAIRQAAICAAFHDPRFPALTAPELPDLHIQVSVLAPPWPLRSLDDLELGRHGVVVRSGTRRGLFLPEVAVEHHFDRETLLARCCAEKAGLAPDAWREPTTEVLLFTTEAYAE